MMTEFSHLGKLPLKSHAQYCKNSWVTLVLNYHFKFLQRSHILKCIRSPVELNRPSTDHLTPRPPNQTTYPAGMLRRRTQTSNLIAVQTAFIDPTKFHVVYFHPVAFEVLSTQKSQHPRASHNPTQKPGPGGHLRLIDGF